MDISAIVERLDNITRELERIERQSLARIETQVTATNNRVNELEQWRAGTEMMLESINERIGDNTDHLEHCKAYGDKERGELWVRIREHQTWIDEQRGGTMARAQTWAIFATAAMALIALIKVIFFHN